MPHIVIDLRKDYNLNLNFQFLAIWFSTNAKVLPAAQAYNGLPIKKINLLLRGSGYKYIKKIKKKMPMSFIHLQLSICFVSGWKIKFGVWNIYTQKIECVIKG